MKYQIMSAGCVLAEVVVSDTDTDEPELIYVQTEDGRMVVGLDFLPGEGHVSVGHWPDGEEWVEVACTHPVESTA